MPACNSDPLGCKRVDVISGDQPSSHHQRFLGERLGAGSVPFLDQTIAVGGVEHRYVVCVPPEYVPLFEGAGIELIDPSCGACIQAGPRASSTADEVTVSAIHRNVPGRSGPG